jgi:nitroreductase
MELIDAIRTRRSALRLTAPAPTDDELLDLVSHAATGPDHGLLRPWRLVTVRDAAREALGEAFAADLPATDAEVRARVAAKPLRGPLLVSIVFAPQPNPKVPDWEQLAATAMMVHNLALLLHVQGWGAMWRTGEPSRSELVRKLLGVTATEQLLGWLYVGTPDRSRPLPPRPVLDARERVFTLRANGDIAPLLSTSDTGSPR